VYQLVCGKQSYRYLVNANDDNDKTLSWHLRAHVTSDRFNIRKVYSLKQKIETMVVISQLRTKWIFDP
jgi:hypothetical protein